MDAWTKPTTYRDLLNWLRTLSSEELDLPVLVSSGADNYGSTQYANVETLVRVARDHPQISGNYQGPLLLAQKLNGEKQEDVQHR